MIPLIDVTKLPVSAQRALDPKSPGPMRMMAARGVVPGIKPADLVTTIAVLTDDADPAVAELAHKSIHALPTPMLQAALVADLKPFTIAKLCDAYVRDTDVMSKLLNLPRIALETVEAVAAFCGEAVADLIATNEERLLAHPKIVERLWMNKATRMSTADRVLELAARHDLPIEGIPAYQEVLAAIRNQTKHAHPPEVVDENFHAALQLGAQLSDDALLDNAFQVDDEGQEAVTEKFVPLYARIGNMTISQKIRMATLGSAAERALLLRDTNRLVCTAAIRSPLIQDPDIIRASASRVVSEDVLRVIAQNKDWLRHHQVKVNLVGNPRTPFVFASKLMSHMRDHELKILAKSKNVSGPIASLAKQVIARKGPGK